MRGSRVVVVGLLTAATLWPARASAQSPDARAYVLAGGGLGSLSDDEGGLGNGPAVGGALGWWLSDTVAIEGAVTRIRHERTGSLAWRGTPLTVTARVIKMWGTSTSRARAFAGGGGGYIRYAGTRTDTVFDAPGIGRTVEQEWRVQGLALEGGGGVHINVTRHVLVRPEAWLTLSRPDRRGIAPEPPYTMPRVMVTAGVSF
jgi:hypothetical protein